MFFIALPAGFFLGVLAGTPGWWAWIVGLVLLYAAARVLIPGGTAYTDKLANGLFMGWLASAILMCSR